MEIKILINTILGSLIIGYFIGCINLSYILSRLKGFDIRSVGSGNAGASNVVIVIGRKIGLFIALLDILKAFLAFNLAEVIFPEAMSGTLNWAGVLAGVGSVIGHIFPFYMGFKGGKGIASTVGVLIALDIRIAILWAVVFFAFAIASKYVSLGSIMAMTFVFFCQVFCLFRGLLVPGTVDPAFRMEYAALALLISGLAVWKHRSNIGRLLSGTESKVKVFTKGMDVGRK